MTNPNDLVAELLEESHINLGMNTMLESRNLPSGALQLVKNGVVRYDRTTRRAGSSLFTPVRPDTLPVLRLGFLKKEDGTPYTIRLTRSSGFLLNGSSWDILTATPALTGTDFDRIDITNVLDKFIFTNNGSDPVQTVDFVAKTITPLGNAPNFRYITGFNNRAVGFALRGTNEVYVGWSADGNSTQWDPDVDDTAGNTPLVDSPDDFSDLIKRGLAFSNMMIIMREKSIWHATKQPIPQNPFYFYSAVPGVGCSCPWSVQVVNNGVAWVDTETKSIYAYSPGNSPERIGSPIEKTLLKNIDDPEKVFSCFDTIDNEYSVFIPAVGSDIVQVWVYNFNTHAWAYNEYFGVSTCENVKLGSPGTRIEDLVGTIENLTGTIESLSPSSNRSSVHAMGRTDGSISIEDAQIDVDAPHDSFPNGIAYDTVLVSKTFTLPGKDLYLSEIRIEYNAIRSDFISIEYSKTGGDKESSWILAKQTRAKTDKPHMFVFKKMVKCRRIAWRLTTQAGLVDILSYQVFVYPSGPSRG